MPWLRRHAAFAVVLALALLLRVPALGWLPSPAGDEGNWAMYGLQISRGGTPSLAPDASFVSMLFGYLIAAPVKVFGAHFAATRAVNVLGIMAAIAGAYALLSALGSRRAGLAAAAVLAVHPWTVMYSRTASVPYALALCAMLLGPLLFLLGLRQGRAEMAGAGLVVASLGLHFSPLGAIGLLACAAAAVRPEGRWVLRQWPLWAAAVLGAAHTLPVVLGALRVARAAPDLAVPEPLSAQLAAFAHMVGTGLMGEATVRHFTDGALTPGAAAWLIVPLLAVLGLAFRAAWRGVLSGFAVVYFALALVALPLILAPGRNWHMPANHMDRYLFALLPAFALLAGEIAARARRLETAVVGVLCLWLLVGGTGRVLRGLWRGGVDHGEGILDGGGGYRGWLVSDVPRATLMQVRDVVLQQAGPGRAAVLVADRAFIPLAFALHGAHTPVFDVRRTTVPATRDGLYFVLLWPDRVLSVDDPPTAHPKYVASNRRLRQRMGRLFGRVSLVKVLRQRDGTPLLEIWRAEDPLPRLRLREEPAPAEGAAEEADGERP